MPDLDAAAERINEHYQLGKEEYEKAKEHGRQLDLLLLEMKEELGDDYGRWVAEHLPDLESTRELIALCSTLYEEGGDE